MRILVVLLVLCGMAAADSPKVAYRLKTQGPTPGGRVFTSWATCFPVGAIKEGGTLLVGAAHTLEGADRAQVQIGGTWHAVRRIWTADTADLAAIEIDAETEAALPFGESSVGLTVELLGYGSEYNGGKAEALRGRLIEPDTMVGKDGWHAIHGDSGGPAVDLAGRVVGVCSEVHWIKSKTGSRSDYAAQNAETKLVPVEDVKAFLAQYYQQQCGPDGCTIWMGGGVQSVRPRPVISRPVPVQPVVPTINTESIVRDEVRKWLDANATALRGKDGRDGKDGVSTVQPLRVILSRDGKIIDDETLQPGDPLILDVRQLGGGK